MGAFFIGLLLRSLPAESRDRFCSDFHPLPKLAVEDEHHPEAQGQTSAQASPCGNPAAVV
ncbi:UNVERIFIED_CONTAM: hypothetical protein Sangu_0889400 [Sesamum angustifolium]|uniref:Uncharacterized protein n=1 Tax=Sesamum angustifolium TaxID=2727405 RepID=A0AAW2PEP6_9LAMI